MDRRAIAGSILGVGVLVGAAVLTARMRGQRELDSLEPVAGAEPNGADRLETDADSRERASVPVHQIAAGPEVRLDAEGGIQLPLGQGVDGFESVSSDQLDVDGDGVISPEEHAVADERFRVEREARRQQWLLEQYDKDNDGVLSDTELAQQETDRQDRERRRAERKAERLAEALAAYDADADGSLSEEEKQAGREARRAYMSGQQEALKALFADQNPATSEFDPVAVGDAADRFFTQLSLVRSLDFDGDSAITPADMPAFMDMFAAGDPRADVDHNGLVDTADVARFHQQTLEPVDPRLAEAVAWFNNAPPPVDAGFANIMMFTNGGNLSVGSLEGGSFMIEGGGATITLDGMIPEIGDDSSAIVIIQTIEGDSEKDK